jgi:hypothetical protein
MISQCGPEKIVTCAEHIVKVAKAMQDEPHYSAEQTRQAFDQVESLAWGITETIAEHRAGKSISRFIGVHPA